MENRDLLLLKKPFPKDTFYRDIVNFEKISCFQLHKITLKLNRMKTEEKNPAVMPCPAEYLLVTACILYPEVKIEPEEHSEPFVCLVDTVLYGEELPLELPLHRELLDTIISGERTEKSRTEMRNYRQQYGEEVLTYYEQATTTTDLLKLILFKYMEERLTGIITRLHREVRSISNEEERQEVAEELDHRTTQLEMVSDYLKDYEHNGQG